MISANKFFFLLLLCFPVLMYGQSTSGAIKIGVANPAVADAGAIFGFQWERNIDENFDIGWEVDWFHKSFTDEKLVQEYNNFNGGIFGTTNELRAKTNLHDFPALFTMTANFPVERHSKLRVFGSVGLGLDFLFISFRDYSDPAKDDTKGAVDFSWRVGGGIIYPLGSRSEFIVEANYHSSQPSWEYEVNDQSTTQRRRVFERTYDMRGLMLRAGIRFFY